MFLFIVTDCLGSGVYFAERPCKSDQYMTADKNGLCYLFLSRVTMGKPFVTQRTRTNIRRLEGDAAGHDSLLSEIPSSKYREFVVYDRSQCYPELLIAIERTDEENPQ